METFSAVKTTGIYCRPGCSARPNPDNVTGYTTAAAAEAAGYRACMRCRPYRTDLPITTTEPELVCRAVQLILDGALDDGTEADLGARLGISARHLRRYFRDHLGVTPDQLARSRRAHFARRLLDDTDLTNTEIAFAAGFGSVRQYNRALQEIFRAAPSELRARRRRADRLVADGGLTLRLPFRPPLDWETMLDYFAARAIPGVEHASADGYRRTIVVDGDPGVLELLPGGDDHLLLRAHLPHWEDMIHVVQRARRIFNLDADVAAANEHLGADRALRPLLRARPGLRPAGTWDPFETGVRAIIGQQVSVAAATTVTGRLVATCGTPVLGLTELGLTHTFPTPETLAEHDLDGVGLTKARAAAVRTFAGAVAADTVRLDRSVPLDTFVASVAALPGLGPWTAQYLALRLGEADAFPTTDLALARTVAELGANPEAWKPWRAHAAVHLWMADAAAWRRTA